MPLIKEQALANLGAENVSKRINVERLWENYNDAFLADEEAIKDGDPIEDEVHRKCDELMKNCYQAMDALKAEHKARSANDKRPTLVAYEQAKKALLEGFEGWHSDLQTRIDDDGREVLVHCALTGLVIGDDDAVLVDENTGEIVLKAALGLPLTKSGKLKKDDEVEAA